MNAPFIPKKDCKNRIVYKIHSRNLELGVYDERDGGFIGFREKFGSVYLFKEFHYDNGPPFGTVRPDEETGWRLPAFISLDETLGTVCGNCGGVVEYNGVDAWNHTSKKKCENAAPQAVNNDDLSKWLNNVYEKVTGEKALK